MVDDVILSNTGEGGMYVDVGGSEKSPVYGLFEQ